MARIKRMFKERSLNTLNAKKLCMHVPFTLCLDWSLFGKLISVLPWVCLFRAVVKLREKDLIPLKMLRLGKGEENP